MVAKLSTTQNAISVHGHNSGEPKHHSVDHEHFKQFYPIKKRSMNTAFLVSSFRRYLFSSPQKHHRDARFVGEGGSWEPGDDIVTSLVGGEGGSISG